MCQELPQRDPILNTNGLDINLMGPQNQITPWLDKGAVFAMNAMDFFLTIHRPFSFSNVFCTLSPLSVFFFQLYTSLLVTKSTLYCCKRKLNCVYVCFVYDSLNPFKKPVLDKEKVFHPSSKS